MKWLKICLVILFAAMVINFARDSADFHIVRSIPFLGGDPISGYDLAGIFLIGLLIWSIARLNRNRNRRNYR